MITHALLQSEGLGPARLSWLNEIGIHSWRDVIERADEVGFRWMDALVSECHRCEQALQEANIAYFVERFTGPDRWRILAHYIDQTSFFDIETTGLEYDAPISVIVCWHQGRLHSFVEHENLDDFLDLLDEITLLASFNGSSFDVPRLLDSFHIPQLPCPHLDLRWLSYHQGHRGGLKQIAYTLGIQRPHDLTDADGELAIYLWTRWMAKQDRSCRDRLVRYCGSDVLLTLMLAHSLAGRPQPQAELWDQLGGEPAPSLLPLSSLPLPPGNFGAGSPSKLRSRRVS